MVLMNGVENVVKSLNIDESDWKCVRRVGEDVQANERDC